MMHVGIGVADKKSWTGACEPVPIPLKLLAKPTAELWRRWDRNDARAEELIFI